MARLTRKNNKLFCENAQQSDVGQFGSLNAGTKVETTDIDTIQSLPAWQDGWQAATLGDNCYPTRQERNGLDYVQSYLLNYLYQEGIPEWSANTTYYKGSIIKLINGTDIQLYKSLKDNNTAVLSDSTAWEEFNYANKDLSNLSATGEKVIDGQWVESYLEIYDGSVLSSDTDYSLANYLPNDNYKYEVLFSCYATTAYANGSQTRVYLKTDIISTEWAYVTFAVSRTTIGVASRGCVTLPVGSMRNVKIYAGPGDSGTIGVRALAYRRIGTNN